MPRDIGPSSRVAMAARAAMAAVAAMAALALLLASAPGCSGPGSGDRPLAASSDMPGCRLVPRKCSRCHESDRIFAYAPQSPRAVRALVERMRHKGGSNINASDGQAITECLVVERFGREGLDTLNRGTQADAQ